MKWKDSDDTSQFKDQPQDEFNDEDDYPLWEKPKRSAFSEMFFKKIEIPFLLIGCGLVILIVFFLISVSGKENKIEAARVESLEKRLGLLEDRVFKVEGASGDVENIADQGNRLNQLQKKMQQFEASIGPKLNQLASAVTTMQKRMANIGPGKTVVPKPSAATTKTGQKQYHQVRSGETLYSIGRRYGVSIKDLRRLNNLAPESVIYPGQKIAVGITQSR